MRSTALKTTDSLTTDHLTCLLSVQTDLYHFATVNLYCLTLVSYSYILISIRRHYGGPKEDPHVNSAIPGSDLTYKDI